MNLDDYVFPDPDKPKWYVEHHYSTGSTMDGTRRHVWRATPLTRALLDRNVGILYDSVEAAEVVAQTYTTLNQEP